MAKTLYRVTLEAEMQVCVLADDPKQARTIALRSAGDEIDARSGDIWDARLPVTVIRLTDVEPEWHDSRPYGTDGDKTVAELLAPKLFEEA